MRTLNSMALLSLLSPAVAHMGMSMIPGGASLDQRGRGDGYRSPIGGFCHGQSGRNHLSATVQAGDTIKLRTSGGAGHGGGACAVFVRDEGRLVKINDWPHCTARAGNVMSFPTFETFPSACANRCTIVWIWTPANSGTCETYMNCWHIKINGAKGGSSPSSMQKLGAPTVALVPPCRRPARNGLSTMMGRYVGKTPNYKLPDVDCVGNFTDWTTCNTECKETRTYQITVPSKEKGLPCEYESGFMQQRQCATGDCPGADPTCADGLKQIADFRTSRAGSKCCPKTVCTDLGCGGNSACPRQKVATCGKAWSDALTKSRATSACQYCDGFYSATIGDTDLGACRFGTVNGQAGCYSTEYLSNPGKGTNTHDLLHTLDICVCAHALHSLSNPGKGTNTTNFTYLRVHIY